MRIYLLALLLISFFACQQATPEPAPTTTATPANTGETNIVPDQPTSSTPRIVFYGNSLTAAYGLEPEQGFTALIERKLDRLGYNYEVVNAGLSGETTTGGLDRIDWVLRQPVDIFVLELGGNDGLRGTDPALTEQNLDAMIRRVIAKYPNATILLAGMQAPPNMGSDFTTAFKSIYPRLAAQYEQVELIPFLLEDVGGIPSLNLPDGIHPNVEGQKLLARNVWAVLEGELERAN